MPPTPGQPTKQPIPLPARTALMGRSGAALPLRTTGDQAVPGETERGYQAAAETPRASSVEGRWIVDRSSLSADYPGGLDQLMLRDLTLTEKGRNAIAGWTQDSPDNPELNCITKPTPAMIIYTDLYPM